MKFHATRKLDALRRCRRYPSRRWTIIGATSALGALAAITFAATTVPHARGQGQPGGSPGLTPFGSSTTYQAAVKYPAGWNLISGRTVQGLAAQGIDVPLLSYSSADGYQPATVDSQASPLVGYWAYFAQPTRVELPAEPLLGARVPIPAGQYVLIGNPGATVATLGRGDLVYAYDPATGTYNRRYGLTPGEGAWAYSAGGDLLVIVSSPFDCQALQPPAALPNGYVPPVTTSTPTTVPASVSCFGPG